jgi:hypothetical protein
LDPNTSDIHAFYIKSSDPGSVALINSLKDGNWKIKNESLIYEDFKGSATAGINPISSFDNSAVSSVESGNSINSSTFSGVDSKTYLNSIKEATNSSSSINIINKSNLIGNNINSEETISYIDFGSDLL